MIKAGAKAQMIDRISAFFRTARHTDHLQALAPGQLPDNTPHGTRRGRHNDGLALFRLQYVIQSDPGRVPRHPQNAHRSGQRRKIGIDRPDFRIRHHRMAGPTGAPDHDVAHLEPRTLSGDHLAHAAGFHCAANVDRRRVGFRRIHAPTHIGIQRLPDHPHQNFARPGRVQLRGLKAKIIQCRRATGAAGQHDAGIFGHWAQILWLVQTNDLPIRPD